MLAGDQESLFDHVAHIKALGMKIVELGEGSGVMSIPYSKQLIGNPQTGVVHGGVITSLLDTVSGVAVICSLDDLIPLATLDLRIDYMTAATPGKTIFARAECMHTTKSIAFVKGSAYHEASDSPIATSVATFMLKSGSVKKRKQTPQD